MRFSPPSLSPSPELRWVVASAFSRRADLSWPSGLDAGRTLELAKKLDLAARIGGRLCQQGGTRDERENGFREAYRATAALAFRLVGLAAGVVRIATERGIPVALLKFHALHAAGYTPMGFRRAGDADLLVPDQRCFELRDALLERGYSPSGLPDQEHHMAPLYHPRGGTVELHRLVLGVRPEPGQPSLGFDGLARAGLLLPARLLGSPCFVPRRDVLIAHAVVHGLAQHGFTPGSYAPMRLVADLVDLLDQRDDGIDTARRFVGDALPEAELDAAVTLAARLARGESLESLIDDASEPAAGRLLWHLVAGTLDVEYARSLRWRSFREVLTDSRGVRALFEVARQALWPTRAQIASIHGSPTTRAGYLGRLLLRPFDLMRRGLGHLLRSMRFASAGRGASAGTPRHPVGPLAR